MRTWPAWVAAVAAVAGCAAGPVSPQAFVPAEASWPRAGAPAFDFSSAIDPDHGGNPAGHALPALHTGSHGLRLVGYDPLATVAPEASNALMQPGAAHASGEFVALDVWRTWVCVAHWARLDGARAGSGATLVDLSRPDQPRVAARVTTATLATDCQFTDDGRRLLVATTAGLDVFDVEDKQRPVLLLQDSSGDDGADYHNVFTAQIGGTDYVFRTYSGDILAIDEEGRRLERVSSLDGADHDVWVGRHAVSGQWILATGLESGAGDGAGGVVLYDLDDPAKPVLLGTWDGHGAGGPNGWHRQWGLTETVGGRALLVAAGETGAASEPYVVLDITDPTRIAELGSWEVPNARRPNGLPLWTFSPHEFTVWDGYVASANYHAGVWVFDVGSPARANQPATLGYYLPHEVPQATAAAGGTGFPGPTPGAATNAPFAQNPWVWSAAFDDRGYLVAADMWSGLYVLEFDGTRG